MEIWIACILLSAFLPSWGRAQNPYLYQNYSCFPAIFSFGDDWADTGNAAALYPSRLGEQEDQPPYGSSFFQNPAHRLSDGRLMIDFFAQAFHMPFLAAYAVGLAMDFHHGVSFAVAGSTASFVSLQVPYPLALQVQWLQRFMSDVMDTYESEDIKQPLPDLQAFKTGLYLISSGQNDYRYAFIKNKMNPLDVELHLVPLVVENITAMLGMLTLGVGARNIMVMNLPPLGCSPEFLALFPSAEPEDYDAIGCLKRYSAVSRLHNQALRETVAMLRLNLNSSYMILYVDMAQIFADVLYDPEFSGFENGLEACCGAGSHYNFNPDVPCGEHGSVDGVNVTAGVCRNPAEYVSWDGVHTTEAFNSLAVQAILTGNYVIPPNHFHCRFDAHAF